MLVIDATQFILASKYHDSAGREKTTSTPGGNTSSGTWFTIDSFTVTLPQNVSSYKGNMDVVKITGATWDMSGRIKIGSELSNVINIQNPTTNDSGIVTISTLTPGSTVTVEVQGIVQDGTTVNVLFDRTEYTDQDAGHFA